MSQKRGTEINVFAVFVNGIQFGTGLRKRAALILLTAQICILLHIALTGPSNVTFVGLACP